MHLCHSVTGVTFALAGVIIWVETIDFWPNLAVVSPQIISLASYCPKV